MCYCAEHLGDVEAYGVSPNELAKDKCPSPTCTGKSGLMNRLGRPTRLLFQFSTIGQYQDGKECLVLLMGSSWPLAERTNL